MSRDDRDKPRTARSGAGPRHGDKPNMRNVHVTDAAGNVDWAATQREFPLSDRQRRSTETQRLAEKAMLRDRNVKGVGPS